MQRSGFGFGMGSGAQNTPQGAVPPQMPTMGNPMQHPGMQQPTNLASMQPTLPPVQQGSAQNPQMPPQMNQPMPMNQQMPQQNQMPPQQNQIPQNTMPPQMNQPPMGGQVSSDDMILQAFAQENVEGVKTIIFQRNGRIDVDKLEKMLKKKPLHWAASDRKRVEFIPLLVAAGALLNEKDEFGNTPLHTAISNGLYESVKVLLSQGAEPNEKNTHGLAPIHIAYQRELISLLISFGARINEKTITGDTSLLLVLRNGKDPLEVAQTLLESGADPNICNKNGDYPLHVAFINDKCLELTRVLLEKNANPNVQDQTGRTPLSLACSKGHFSLVKELLKKGADPLLEDNKNMSAYDYAKQGGHEFCVEVIEPFTSVHKPAVDPLNVLMKQQESVIRATTDRLEASFKELQVLKHRYDELETTMNKIHSAVTTLKDVEHAALKSKSSLQQSEEALGKQMEEISKLQAMMVKTKEMQETRVVLNVGGKEFITSRATLLKYDCYFKTVFSEFFAEHGNLEKPKDGSQKLFIDRNGALFDYVLDFMRADSGEDVILPTDEHTVRRLLNEAKFYMLQPFVELIQSRLGLVTRQQ